MAEGWTKHLWEDRIEAYSAGLDAQGLNAHAVRVMAETGVYIYTQRSKTIRELKEILFDYVIIICSFTAKNYPSFPNQTRIFHIGFFDEAIRKAKETKTEKEALLHYRHVRDEIRAFVESLPEILEEEKSRPLSYKSRKALRDFQ